MRGRDGAAAEEGAEIVRSPESLVWCNIDSMALFRPFVSCMWDGDLAVAFLE
jgi:hypothetical protein